MPVVSIIKVFPKPPILLSPGILVPPIAIPITTISPGGGGRPTIDHIPIPPKIGGGGPPDPTPLGGGKPDPNPSPITPGGPDQNQDPGAPPEQEDPAYSWSVKFMNWCYTVNGYLNEKAKDAKYQTAMGPLGVWLAYTVLAVPSNHIVNADLKQYLDQWLFDVKVLQALFNPTDPFTNEDRNSIAFTVTELTGLIDGLSKLDSNLNWYGFMNNSAGKKGKDIHRTGGLHQPSDMNKPAERTQKTTWEELFRNWRNNSATHMTALRRTETNERIGVLNAELCSQMTAGTPIKTISRKLGVWKKDIENIADEIKDLNNATSYDQPLQRLLGEQLTKVKTLFNELVKIEPSYTYSGDVEKK